MGYIYTQDFDWWDKDGSYYEVTIDFNVDEIGEWVDGVWCIFHDVTFIAATWYSHSDDIEGFVCQEKLLVERFGSKQVTEWTEYVREKLDQEYVYE